MSMKSKLQMSERISELHEMGILSMDHSRVVTGAIYALENSSDKGVGDVVDLISTSMLVRGGTMDKKDLATLVETTFGPKVSVSRSVFFGGGTVVFVLYIECHQPYSTYLNVSHTAPPVNYQPQGDVVPPGDAGPDAGAGASTSGAGSIDMEPEDTDIEDVSKYQIYLLLYHFQAHFYNRLRPCRLRDDIIESS